MKKVIEIPKEMSNYIESLQYECNARADLISYLVRQDLDQTDAFKRYHNEFVEFFTQFEMAKSEMEDTYIKPLFDCKTNWSLDYATSEVTVNVVS